MKYGKGLPKRDIVDLLDFLPTFRSATLGLNFFHTRRSDLKFPPS